MSDGPSTAVKVIGVAVCAALAGTLYILVNEERRNNKERKKAAGSSGADGAGTLTAERLIEVLTESAHAAYQLIEQTRKMVHEKHVSTGQSLESCVDELQKDFESAMEAVIGSIRNKHGVSEKVMTDAMVANQHDAVVQAKVAELREAMNGKAPPGYGAAAAAPEPTNQRGRRGGRGRGKR